jgi:hypothetical protein
MASRLRDRVHPDDALRRLARTGRPTIGQTADPGRAPKPPSAVRQFNAAAIAILAVMTAIAIAPFAIPQHTVRISGVPTSLYLNARQLAKIKVVMRVTPVSALARLDVRLDGQTVPIVRRESTAEWVPPADITDGRHRLVVRSGSSVLWRGPARRQISFIVDRVRPELTVRSRRNVDGQDLIVDGTTEVGVKLLVNGIAVPVQKDGDRKGTFRATFRRAPIGTVEIVATDAAKNTRRRLVRASTIKPRIRAVHVTARGWQIRSVREPVFRMIAARQINTVMITLKDEDGGLAYKSTVPRANEIGASQDVLDLRATIDELHAKGVRVIGRVVAFRDPLYVANAIRTGHPDRIVSDLSGQPFTGSDGVFANPVNADAQQYVLDIAAEVSTSGIDDLILDDVRRPAGLPTSMRLVGLGPSLGGLDASLTSFLRRAGSQLRGVNIGFGVTVLGASITDPLAYGQSLPRFAPVVDYIAPKLFPSRFPAGSFGLKDPPSVPHKTVAGAVKATFRAISATDAALLPFLQDFSEGRPNGPADVRAQIDAVDELGIGRFVLIDPKMSYNTGGIPKRAEQVLGASAPTTTSATSTVPSITP